MNPLANIATAAKGTDVSRSDSALTSSADAADSGFARELQRQIDRDTKPASNTGSTSTTKADNSTPPATGKTAGEAQDARTKAPEDAQAAPDVATLLGSLLVQSSAGSQPGDDAAATEDSALTTPPLPSDTALAALVAANERPLQAPPTVTLAGQAADTANDSRKGPTVTLSSTSSDTLADGLGGGSASERWFANAGQPAGAAAGHDASAVTAAADATAARIAATSETAGKNPELAAESTPVNNFAGIHAAALAHLRGEATPQVPSPVPLHVATPAGSPGWPEEVGSRVSWMVGHDESHAQLTLTPPQLGRIEVSITVSGDQTSAQFVAATPAARELIEQSLPRLREVLEQSGINLGQTDVGTSSQSNNSGDEQRRNGWGARRDGDDGTAPRSISPQWSRRGDGLVDTFA
ncbi:MAG: flagellar hook-length control protein FliK [Proteobacteria bacterium]|nr:flagellar hook-length control protein FliK [Pseudomonadota bacterium]